MYALPVAAKQTILLREANELRKASERHKHKMPMRGVLNHSSVASDARLLINQDSEQMLIVAHNEGGTFKSSRNPSQQQSISLSKSGGVAGIAGMASSPKFLIQAELLYKKEKFANVLPASSFPGAMDSMLSSSLGRHLQGGRPSNINSQGREPLQLSQGGPKLMSDKVRIILAQNIDATLQTQLSNESRPDLLYKQKNILNATTKQFRKRQNLSKERRLQAKRISDYGELMGDSGEVDLKVVNSTFPLPSALGNDLLSSLHEASDDLTESLAKSSKLQPALNHSQFAASSTFNQLHSPANIKISNSNLHCGQSK